MIKAFISHSSKDKPFVRKLKDDLKFNGIDTWFDEDELKAGDKLLDTLIFNLQNSSHFLIVLSNNIKNSHWVETELNEAISSLDKNLIKKIIPIIFRKTEIPKPLEGLLYADFSDIVFTKTIDEKVDFKSDKYLPELTKIINSILKSNEFSLTNSEIKTLVNKIDNSQTSSKKNTKIIGLYEIIGFNTNEARHSYIENMKGKYKNSKLAKIPTKKVTPVILPSLLKHIFDNLKLGDSLFFPISNNTKIEAHFCGFSSNNTRIVLPHEIRRKFEIRVNDILKISIDGESKEILFYEY